MNRRASDAQIAAAETYEQLFVPAEFEEWTSRVADAAALRVGEKALDVACGTGVLTREAERRVGPRGLVVGVDPDAGMLAVAARRAPDICWCEGDARALPFADGSFDVVVSQFGLMYFGDRVLGIREMLRILKSGGRLAVAVWGSLEHTPAYADLLALLERAAGRKAADALRVPFELGDTHTLAGIFASAGLPEARITTHVGRGRFPDVRSMVEAEVRGWLPLVGVVIADTAMERILEEAEDVLRPYTSADGRVAFDAPAHIVAATKESAH